MNPPPKKQKKLGGYTISGRDRGRRSWEDWERGHRSFATVTGVQNKEASIAACGGGGQHEVERETSSRIQPPSLPLSASSAGGSSSSERRLLPENSCGGELVAGEEEEVGEAVHPVAVAAAAVAEAKADPADPFHGDLPLAREQRLKMAVAETGSATVEAAASTASLNGHNRGGGGGGGGASAAGRPPPPSAFAGGGSRAAGTDDRARRGGGVSSSSNGLQGGDRKKDDSARMRRYLPGTKGTGQQHSLGAARGEGAPQPRSSPGRKDKDPPVEGKNGGKDMASEAESRAEEPALLSSRRKGAVNKTSSGGGGGGGEQQHPDDDKAAAEDASTQQQRHQRKCPPAVGFVGGFRDVPVGAPSSGRRKSTTEALIHALSEPLKPSPRHAAGAEASVGLGGGEFPKTSGRWPTTTKASNGKGATAVQQGRSGGGSGGGGRPRPNARDAFSRVALDERSREMAPPNRNVTITFDPGASTLLGCITANTDVYGPALCSDTAATLTREETAAYLERWVLIAVKHGVLPRELRALLQDEGHGQRGGTPGYYSVREEGRETAASTGTVGEDGGGPYRVGGRSGTGGTGSSSPHGLGGDSVTSVSWTKYGWNRFDVAAPSAGVAGDVQTPQPRTQRRRRRRRQLALDDEEVEEEEEMENIAEALVGAAPWRREGRSRPPDPVVGTGGGSSFPPSERRGGGGGSANGEKQQQASLGWRVLEVVEARFESGLHPPRIVAIGDVHGCVNEMKDLVRKVEYWPGDLLLFLGDLVAKGPNSAGVVRTARELGGVSVRGNHEFEVLRWLNVGENENGRGPSAHHQIAMSLGEDDGLWLKNSPWYFQCEELDALFVHAGFIPGVSMKRQNPRMMMNMRSLTLEGGAPTSKVVENRPWAREWAGPDTVFFGHDAARGLQVLDQAMGLDTGCVYGGRLTACILPERRLVSVASKAAYMQYRKKRRRSVRGSGAGGGWSEQRGRGGGDNGNGGTGGDERNDGRLRSPYDKLSPG
ncbi:conserved unknown protein [Ectocarpus siliculosus]|uniref:Calcineurin-like phosphoesterase domain-containing protein n=1 Tax=Ectocarpus siliculosus TaxID=2880 RepID=D7FU33_ECTSI|nr:conserved unknown protein [Ectocarpus siliculosus]|eukprot:CBJ31560.1 conserved unknown protein [Ectocarpus siliculosus]